MEKALELLEKHCQWLAVGLGGLFLGWMLWSYVLMSPVSVAGPGGAEYNPGNVDTDVSRNYAKPLDTLLSDNAPAVAPQVATKPQGAEFQDVLSGANVRPKPLAEYVINSQPSEFTIGKTGGNNGEKRELITELPKLPSAPIVEALSKKAYVGPAALVNGAPAPPAPPVPAPVAQPAANGQLAANGQPAVAGQPVQPPLPPGNDLCYVRVSYNIPTTDIAKAFDEKKVPTGIQTGVLGVKLMRQEMLANGTWSDAIEVPLPKTGVVTWPPPADKAPIQIINQFRAWSDSPAGMTDILRPIFYPIVFGEGPWDPSMDDALPAFDPKKDQAERARKYKEMMDARKAAAPRSAPRSTPSRGGSGRRGGPAGGMDAPGINDAQRPANAGGAIGVQYPGGTPRYPGMPPAGMRPPYPNGTRPPMPGDTDTTPPDQQPVPQQVAPGAGLPPQQPLPAPNFQPATTAPFICWAYDETVVEGHTYRYQVLYALRNPLFQSNLVKPPLDAVFAIWSVLSTDAWGDSVEVKSTAEYYLNATNWTGDRIPPGLKVDVYKWAHGKWQMHQFSVAPGDEVGDTEADNINYGTNVTVVDLRYDPRGNGGQGRPYVLLLTPDGRLVEREPTADRNNDRMNRLKALIAAGQNQTPGNGQPAGMMPPGMGGMPPGTYPPPNDLP